MPLSTSLITGAQSLFGVKGEFQFGNTFLTTVFSEQQSEARNITVQGGGVLNNFKIKAIDYDENQHYFLTHYFRDNYDKSLENYPVIASTINITKIEVWRIDLGNSNLQEQHPVIALRDLGESNTGQLPDNSNINLYNTISTLAGIRDASTTYNTVNGVSLPVVPTSASPSTVKNYESGKEFVVHKRVKKLSESEYSYHAQLGYISLNQKLNNDQLLAVAFQYRFEKSR